MSDILEEPPDENEAFESLDEALDEQDALRGFSGGPEGERDLDTDIVVDERALEEIGADLEDPDRVALLDGAMDDPDGSGPPARSLGGSGENWDVTPLEAVLDAGTEGDPELQIVDVDPADLEQVPDDAPGPDSARW